jgi:hypothetical protein
MLEADMQRLSATIDSLCEDALGVFQVKTNWKPKPNLDEFKLKVR